MPLNNRNLQLLTAVATQQHISVQLLTAGAMQQNNVQLLTAGATQQHESAQLPAACDSLCPGQAAVAALRADADAAEQTLELALDEARQGQVEASMRAEAAEAARCLLLALHCLLSIHLALPVVLGKGCKQYAPPHLRVVVLIET